jgi:dTDP-4-amino-4,6-dideoxygalactose transaminase
VFSQPNADREFPLATQAAAEVLCLPCFPELTDGEVDQVVEAVKRAVGEVM